MEPGYTIFKPGQASGAGHSNSSTSRARQLADLSKRFDSNARHRARAQAMIKKRGNKTHESTFDYDEVMEDDTEDTAEAHNAAAGKPVKQKPKAGLNCQPRRPHQMATSAVVDLTAYSFAKGAYETRFTNLVWGLEAYERRWKAELPGHEFVPALPDLVKEIVNRVPGGRTTVKANIHSVIKKEYGWSLIPASQEQVDANFKLYNSIHEDFHFGSLDKPDSHYEHPALKEAFVEGLFDAVHSPCVVYHQYFDPVPVETIAFVLTMMDACIQEWRSGRQVNEHLNSKEQSRMYEKHLHNLGRFASRAPRRLNNMRKEWYAAGVENSVRATEPEGETRATIRLEDIREDTPPPAGTQGDGNGA